MTPAEHYDVVVAGGGFAGIAAAVAAAETGAQTLLVERARVLGGNASNAFVHTVCGLYLAADAGDAVPANPGFATRFAAALREAHAAGSPERAGRVWVLPSEPLRIPAAAAAVCAATPGLDVRLGTELRGLALGGGCDPHRLQLVGARGEHRTAARVVVDTSGDADAAAAAGAEVAAADADTLQLPSYVFRLAGVATDALSGFRRIALTRAVARAARDGALPAGCDSVLVRPGGTPGAAYVTLNLPRPAGEPYAPLDPAQRERLEQRARGWAEAVTALLRERADFSGAHVDAWPARLGVRETRHIVGRDALSRDDVLRGRSRADGVARSSWPIELWHDRRGARFEHPEGACDVPLGSLVSRSHPRLAAAGRCLSASHEALGALRVLGTALATGEAAGTAAALAADAGCGLDTIAAEEVRAHIAERAAGGPS